MTMTLVETITVGSGGAASIEFTGIPGDGKDLLIQFSGRIHQSVSAQAAKLTFNGDTSSSNYSTVFLFGNRSTVASSSAASSNRITPFSFLQGADSTASTFGSLSCLISNYAAASNKSLSIDSVTEDNGASVDPPRQMILAGLWANTNAITSLTMSMDSGSLTLAENSTASLYIIS
jgi:hypothetical protein